MHRLTRAIFYPLLTVALIQAAPAIGADANADVDPLDLQSVVSPTTPTAPASHETRIFVEGDRKSVV